MSRRFLFAALCASLASTLSSCGLVTSTNRSVFTVFDVSGTYVEAVPDAAKFAKLMISELQPGDWVGVSQISACSFSEKEIVLQRQLPETPSMATTAKRELFAQIDNYASQVKSAKYTDIRGAIAQAAFELRQRPEPEKFIVLFSDMVEDHGKGCDTSAAKLDLKGIHVIAANVIKSNPADPDKYIALLEKWETTITESGGTWSLVGSPDQLPELVAAR